MDNQLAALGTDDQNIGEIVRAMQQASETSLVMTTVAALENWLQQAIEARMRRGMSNNMKERLFQAYGPLGAFAGKIDVAYAFRFFEDGTLSDLRAIKDLRNAFAHSAQQLHFDDPKVVKILKRLSTSKSNVGGQEVFRDALLLVFGALKPVIENGRLADAVLAYRDAEIDRRASTEDQAVT